MSNYAVFSLEIKSALKNFARQRKKSTHPGFVERIDSLKKFIEEYEEEKVIKELKTYKWKWIYNRKLNTLIFKPNK